MNSRFATLLTATVLMFSLPACAASRDVDLLTYDRATAAPVIQPDAAPVELTPPVVSETPLTTPAPKKKAAFVKPKSKKAAPSKPAPEKAAAPVVQQSVEKPAAPKPLLLKAGYVIRIDVKDEPDLSGSFPIAADGNINLPLIGAKPAANMTLIDLKTAITAAYKDGYLVDPKISLSKEVSP